MSTSLQGRQHGHGDWASTRRFAIRARRRVMARVFLDTVAPRPGWNSLSCRAAWAQAAGLAGAFFFFASTAVSTSSLVTRPPLPVAGDISAGTGHFLQPLCARLGEAWALHTGRVSRSVRWRGLVRALLSDFSTIPGLWLPANRLCQLLVAIISGCPALRLRTVFAPNP